MTESVETVAAPKGRPLVRKIASIMAEISRVPKRGRHTGLRYDYVQEADLMDLLRDRMADQGVVIFPSVREHRMVESRDDRGRVQFLTTVTMEITLIDSESGDQLTTSWIGQGMDAGDKGYYKAYTGALKYFLLKTFLISTGDEATTPMPPPHERRERHPEPAPPAHHHEAPTPDDPHHEPAEPEPPLDEYPHPEHDDAPEAAPEAAAEQVEAPAEVSAEPAPEPASAPVEEPAPPAEPETPAEERAPEAAQAPAEEPAPAPAAEEPEPARAAAPAEPVADEKAAEAAPVGFSEDVMWQEIFEQLRGQIKSLKGAQRERFLGAIAANRGLQHATELSPEQLAEELEILESLDGDARKAHLKDPAAAPRPDSLAQQFMAAAQDAVSPEMVVGLRRLYLDKMGADMLTEVDEPKLTSMVKKLNKMGGKERAEYISQVLSAAK